MVWQGVMHWFDANTSDAGLISFLAVAVVALHWRRIRDLF